MSKVKIKLFKSDVPKAPVEFTKNADGVVLGFRKVQHVRTYKGKQYVYNTTKGWKKIPEYNPHTLLNSLFISAGFDSIYSDQVLTKAYGI